MVKIIIEIEGMHCGMCEAHVNDAVRKIAGVKKVKAAHARGRAEIIAEDESVKDACVNAVAALGYKTGETSVSEYSRKGLFSRKK